MRRQRWPWVIVVICFFGGLALAEPIDLAIDRAQAQRAADADALLRLLGR